MDFSVGILADVISSGSISWESISLDATWQELDFRLNLTPCKSYECRTRGKPVCRFALWKASISTINLATWISLVRISTGANFSGLIERHGFSAACLKRVDFTQARLVGNLFSKADLRRQFSRHETGPLRIWGQRVMAPICRTSVLKRPDFRWVDFRARASPGSRSLYNLRKPISKGWTWLAATSRIRISERTCGAPDLRANCSQVNFKKAASQAQPAEALCRTAISPIKLPGWTSGSGFRCSRFVKAISQEARFIGSRLDRAEFNDPTTIIL